MLFSGLCCNCLCFVCLLIVCFFDLICCYKVLGVCYLTCLVGFSCLLFVICGLFYGGVLFDCLFGFDFWFTWLVNSVADFVSLLVRPCVL